ncbi:MAG: SUMF1/EgtB/PvdO family nonheme iron enzyme [Planctomycetes bacterium]|nr:SUMF1/EgtB/PvdO family nonheme iron enzyme [Planctomycetota bacterium]
MDEPVPTESSQTDAIWSAYLRILIDLVSENDTRFAKYCAENPEAAAELRRARTAFDTLRKTIEDEAHPEDAKHGRKGSKSKHHTDIDPDLDFEPPVRYAIRTEIGRGGMGVVLRAWDRKLRRDLAMKVILGTDFGSGSLDEKSGANTGVLQRFLDEAQVTSQLDHPGIVPVHEMGLDGKGRAFFTMKLVKGRDLKTIFDLTFEGKEDWNETRVLGIILKTCEAVAYAHSKGVIHRDLKPGNIMIGKFGETYVMDWGLAKVLSKGDSTKKEKTESTELLSQRTDTEARVRRDPNAALLTMDGEAVGTPTYMSPEQAMGAVEQMGPASDVFSMGSILYHLLVKQPPYFDPLLTPSPFAILRAVIKGPPRPLVEINPNIPGELIAICEKAMKRPPEERYPDMLAMAEDLRAYLEGKVVSAYEAGAWAELKKWVKRNKTIAAATSGAFVIAVVSTILVFAVQAHAKSAVEAKNEELTQSLDALIIPVYTNEAANLWPARPEKADAMKAWIDKSEKLATRLPHYRERLNAALANHEKNNVLAALVFELDQFAVPDSRQGLLANMKRRLFDAESIRARSIETHEAEWKAAIDSIRNIKDSPKYKGLEIAAQIGLVPIGKDPKSGLWEFADIQSGDIPKRHADGTLIFTENSSIVFVLIPGGSFMMGSKPPTEAEPAGSPNVDPVAEADQQPVHSVTLKPFFVSKYEMTQGQWLKFTGRNPSAHRPGGAVGGDGHPIDLRSPVEDVTWNDCARVMFQLSHALPTEAQWEYAARAGTQSLWWTGNNKESLVGAANLFDKTAGKSGSAEGSVEAWLEDGYQLHSPVGSFAANAFGLHDVHGNVYEWCRDGYKASYDSPISETGDGEHLVTDFTDHVLRGGSFVQPAHDARSAFRNNRRADFHDRNAGLRPCRVVEGL